MPVASKFSKTPASIRKHAPKLGEHSKEILAEAFNNEGRHEKPRIRGQLPTQINENGIPDIDLTLLELEKSINAGLDEIEVFPINFVRTPEDIPKILQLISEVKK